MSMTRGNPDFIASGWGEPTKAVKLPIRIAERIQELRHDREDADSILALLGTKNNLKLDSVKPSNNMNTPVEQQLAELRERLQEIRIARKWLQEFRVNAHSSLSKPLASYHAYLVEQESKTIQMGRRIKGESH